MKFDEGFEVILNQSMLQESIYFKIHLRLTCRLYAVQANHSPSVTIERSKRGFFRYIFFVIFISRAYFQLNIVRIASVCVSRGPLIVAKYLCFQSCTLSFSTFILKNSSLSIWVSLTCARFDHIFCFCYFLFWCVIEVLLLYVVLGYKNYIKDGVIPPKYESALLLCDECRC
jgi:hypothetical protein